MGFLGRILLLVASALAIMCTLAALAEYRDVISSKKQTEYQKGAISCLFIALFILAGMALFLFITLCCSCSDIIMGIVIAAGGAAAAVFAIIAYGLMVKQRIEGGAQVPSASEWTFACIFTGASILLIALTMAVS
ncbi:hypothetical protein CSKR_104543 [Clonorchis sinensis]|uniref:Uncharacterized protein n=1 Tax=Clonorchis sinensis TaxID=79923 RepID=A0A3R7F0Z8_CLOSI|nr:hypothetical protein CSKR_104543 [Clonorchis sinensis]